MISNESCTFHAAASTATSTTTPTKQPDTPQRVQIMRTPDGRLTVKGLMPGQQLVQMPDGKLQVMTTTQLQNAQQTPQQQQQQIKATAAVTPTKTTVIKNQGGGFVWKLFFNLRFLIFRLYVMLILIYR